LNVGEFLAALQNAGHAVPTRAVKPIYQSVLIRDGRILSSDGEVLIDSPCEIQATLLLPHSRLVAILKTCKADGSVTLTEDETSCTIESGGGKWTLPTEQAGEYPSWAVSGAEPVARLPADQFRRMVRAVAYAVDDESSRYALGGVCIDVQDGKVSFVATDGRRLSKVEAEVDQAVNDSQTLVPARALDIMGRLAVGNGAVQLEATGKEVVCSIDGGTTVIARLLEGRFPKWRDVIPDRPDAVPSTVDRYAMEAAVRAAKICQDDVSRGVQFSFSKDGLWLHAQSSANGEASVTCDVVSFGQAVSVKLDPDFVLEFLQSLPADNEPTIDVEVVDAQSAVVMRTDDYLGLIMPLAKD
jgi:DNA polymerase-3 subunit beta